MTTRLFHISDPHFGAEDFEALAQVERAIGQERPDILVCTGDLTQRATHKQFRMAAEWFGRFDMPVWLDPGNHDMPYANLFERFTTPYKRYNQLQKSTAISTFESDDLVLVPLKTTVRSQNRWPWSDGVVTPSALARCLALLDKLKHDPRRIIVTAHHPLLGPDEGGPNPTIGGGDAFAKLLDAGMDAILSGHIHKPLHQRRVGGIAERSAQMIGAGTLSTRLRGAPPSYNVLLCDPRGNEIAVECRDLV